jgi:xylulokinase
MSFLGIDIGTQGVRLMIATADGTLAAEAEVAFAESANVADLPAGWFEQRPDVWLAAARTCFSELRHKEPLALAAVAAVAVTGTSGTVVPVQADGTPLGNALMYNDRRAGSEADEAAGAGAAICRKLGCRISSSFALPKIIWLHRHAPELAARVAWWLSPADFVAGWLTGVYGVSDPTNMFKTGYDIVDDQWPDYLEELGLARACLPRVVPSGSVIGTVTAGAADSCGLRTSTAVCAGLTDGCASQVSAGAVAVGEWCTTIGTTLVIKGVAADLIPDPAGRVYSHRHPDGYWLPGGAGNVGAGCLPARFGDAVEALSEEALAHSPSGLLCYPLLSPGERFPFVCEQAEGFEIASAADPSDQPPVRRFAGHLEGIACVEDLAYTMLARLGFTVGDTIRATGGGARSDAWLQIRADVLGRQFVRPAQPAGAFGAAVLAASRTAYSSLAAAAEAMVRPECTVCPRPDRAAYVELSAAFTAECRRRGYLDAW